MENQAQPTKEHIHLLRSITKSGFVRSVFLRLLLIFVIVSIAIVAIAFVSFTSEINRSIMADRQKQLVAVEETISSRMEEISNIAYSIGTDPSFYLEPVEDARYSGYEMSASLARYVSGNQFIQHLAYYRLSEPDKIYVSTGERSFREFWISSLGLTPDAADSIIHSIQEVTRNHIQALSFGSAEKTYFAYTYPLPQLSPKPQAFVLVMIPLSKVAPLLKTLLMDAPGEVAIFDAGGREIYCYNTLEQTPNIDLLAGGTGPSEEIVSADGVRYVIQRQVSDSNGWTLVSLVRRNDILTGLANRQLVFILLLLVLMFVSVFAMLLAIVAQYKPISNLAKEAAGTDAPPDAVDERVLLSSAIMSLKDDSEQKQKYETAYREAEAASRAKSAFLSNMSHDIRTPMNAVIGMNAIAMQHLDDPDYVRQCLQKSRTASQYLLDIINNVLDMSRIESGKVTLSEDVVNLPELLDGLVTIVEPSIKAKEQQFSVETEGLIDLRVWGDSLKLTQIFVNIVSNAVKFTPQGGSIRLGIRETASAQPGVGIYVFTFTDTGIGMSPEFVKRVFDTFTRASDETGVRTEGTGLGMAIAKNLVELMGGAIRCESQVGVGTTFTVTLPMKAAPAERCQAETTDLRQAAYSSQGIPDLTGRHILVAEDNCINLEIAGEIIRATGAEVVTALNGHEAVDAFVNHPSGYFDVILMDLQMPMMSGIQATTAIRALSRPDAQTVPIFAMTASTFEEDVNQVKAAGMNGHIGKPYAPETLYRILEQAVKLSKDGSAN